MATAGLALQVPLAVLLDALLRSPAWLDHAGSTVLTMVGGAVVLVGFFGMNAAGEDDEKSRHAAWEERQAVGGGRPHAWHARLVCLAWSLGVATRQQAPADCMPRTLPAPAWQALQRELDFDLEEPVEGEEELGTEEERGGLHPRHMHAMEHAMHRELGLSNGAASPAGSPLGNGSARDGMALDGTSAGRYGAEPANGHR